MARQWSASAILGTIFSSIFCAGPWLPETAHRWLLLPFVPYQLWLWLILKPVPHPIRIDAIPRIVVWVILVVVTLPVSYVYVVVVERVRRVAILRRESN